MEGALEYGQELEFENFEFEDSEWSGEGEVFSEAELMELAGELLEINSEAELDHFLGKLIKKAGSALGKVMMFRGRRHIYCSRQVRFACNRQLLGG